MRMSAYFRMMVVILCNQEYIFDLSDLNSYLD